MSYFVTGATGFIGRNLVEQLLEREGTVYVLVREGSKGRLEELRNRWGVDEDRVVGIVGDLSEPRLGRLRRRISSGCAAGRAPLPPRGDLRHDRRRRVAADRQRRGHPPHGRVRRMRSRPGACTWSARSPPPASTRAPGARTCSRRRRTSTPIPTSDQARVRGRRAQRVRAAVARLPARDRRRPLRDRRDGQGRRALLLLQADPPDPQHGAAVDADARASRVARSTSSRSTSWSEAMDHIAHADGPRRPRLQPHRPEPAHRRRGDRHLRPRRARAAVVGPRAGRRRSRRCSRWWRIAVSATPFGDAVADRVLADFGIPRSVLVYVNYPTHFDSRQTEAALAGTDITVPPLEAYAGKLWDYWERHLDPDLFRDRTLMGAARGRHGADRRRRPRWSSSRSPTS